MEYKEFIQIAAKHGLNNITLKEFFKIRKLTLTTALTRIKNSRDNLSSKIKKEKETENEPEKILRVLVKVNTNNICTIPLECQDNCKKLWDCKECWAIKPDVTMTLPGYALTT
jgi:hypothetical protein|tara:strand:+ start:11044 stop:11382 length:339 start_codon:yes stop_codon:yes gene_type:complete